MKAPPEAVPKKMNKFPVLTFENGGHFFVCSSAEKLPVCKGTPHPSFPSEMPPSPQGEGKTLAIPLKKLYYIKCCFLEKRGIL